jgi:hypothetical protein
LAVDFVDFVVVDLGFVVVADLELVVVVVEVKQFHYSNKQAVGREVIEDVVLQLK